MSSLNGCTRSSATSGVLSSGALEARRKRVQARAGRRARATRATPPRPWRRNRRASARPRWSRAAARVTAAHHAVARGRRPRPGHGAGAGRRSARPRIPPWGRSRTRCRAVAHRFGECPRPSRARCRGPRHPSGHVGPDHPDLSPAGVTLADGPPGPEGHESVGRGRSPASLAGAGAVVDAVGVEQRGCPRRGPSGQEGEGHAPADDQACRPCPTVAASTPSLSATLAPPTTATKGRAGCTSRPPSVSTSRASSRPAAEGRAGRWTDDRGVGPVATHRRRRSRRRRTPRPAGRRTPESLASSPGSNRRFSSSATPGAQFGQSWPYRRHRRTGVGRALGPTQVGAHGDVGSRLSSASRWWAARPGCGSRRPPRHVADRPVAAAGR